MADSIAEAVVSAGTRKAFSGCAAGFCTVLGSVVGIALGSASGIVLGPGVPGPATATRPGSVPTSAVGSELGSTDTGGFSAGAAASVPCNTEANDPAPGASERLARAAGATVWAGPVGIVAAIRPSWAFIGLLRS
ncbi:MULTISPECIES: hypothetical protein [Cryobacterium]|uniref:Uncharacterized protein n=1 Tax=Cryobacterium breve TaxID=1259258 RepID=A0ABY2IYN3_9MICO|nr:MULTISPECIES: hypothetical protein [Cryobacterium]TFC97590.1 hypothetical protein E3O65_12555 [Cryobacterium breve]